MTGSFTVFNLDPDLRGVDDNVWEQTTVDGYSNIYHGFELSAQGRLAGGGTLFGGWSMEDTGRTTIYNFDSTAGGGSLRRRDQSVLRTSCTAETTPTRCASATRAAFPRPFRHEFKLSGTQPFSLPGPRGHAVRRFAAGVSGRREHPLGRFPGRAQRPPLQR